LLEASSQLLGIGEADTSQSDQAGIIDPGYKAAFPDSARAEDANCLIKARKNEFILASVAYVVSAI